MKKEKKLRNFAFSSSKRKAEKRLVRKANPELVEAIIKIKKKNVEVANELARPSSNWSNLNLSEIEEKSKTSAVLVCGKILSSGDLDKVKKVVAWNISEKAREKIKQGKREFVEIKEEIKKNPELKNLELIK